MIARWKIVPITKGLLTWIPLLNALRIRRAATGGSDSARYCYSVWLRHLITLDKYGFRVKGSRIGELGPGDSLGVGLAALLSGADEYVGLDIVPFSATADLENILDELIEMYLRREPIPDHTEFPFIWPQLKSYEFPEHVVDLSQFTQRVTEIRADLRAGISNGRLLQYKVPWNRTANIAKSSLDLIFSQAVLEHVDDLDDTYKSMFMWLKSGGYGSHVIGFVSHHLAPTWNGHWAFSDLEWRMVRGRREFLINREPLSTHLCYAKNAGFELLCLDKDYGTDGMNPCKLAPRYQNLSAEDARTSSVMLLTQKP